MQERLSVSGSRSYDLWDIPIRLLPHNPDVVGSRPRTADNETPIDWAGYAWSKQLFPDPQLFKAWLLRQKMNFTLNLVNEMGVNLLEAGSSLLLLPLAFACC